MRSISRQGEMSLAEPAALPVVASAPLRLPAVKRFTGAFKASLPAYLLLLPSLAFLALFTYGAVGRVIVDALYQRATPKAPSRFVGLENIIAGTDCGFGTSASSARVHPEIVWAKLAALAEGARLASDRLWDKA